MATRQSQLTQKLIPSYPANVREELAKRAYFYWLNYYLHDLFPVYYAVSPAANVPVVRDWESLQQAVNVIVRNLCKQYLAYDSQAKAPNVSFRNRVKADTQMPRIADALAEFKGGYNFTTNWRSTAASMYEDPPPAAQMRIVRDSLQGAPQHHGEDGTPFDIATDETDEHFVPMTLTPRGQKPGSPFDSPFASLAAYRKNSIVLVGPDGDVIAGPDYDMDKHGYSYMYALTQLHADIRRQLEKTTYRGYTAAEANAIQRGYTKALAGRDPLAPRDNAKLPRRGTRPLPENRREMREQTRQFSAEEVHSARWQQLYNNLVKELRLSSARDLQDLIDTLDTYDFAQMTQAEYNKIGEKLAHAGVYATPYDAYSDDHDGDGYPEGEEVTRVRHRESRPVRTMKAYARQQRLLDERTKSIVKAAGARFGQRLTPLPSKLREILQNDELLRQFEDDFGVEDAGKVAWQLAYGDNKPFIEAPEHIRVEDLVNFSYPAFVKMIQEWGPSANNIYNVRGLRLFGNFESLNAYYKRLLKLYPEINNQYGMSPTLVLHDEGRLAGLNLPHRSEKWDRKKWTELVVSNPDAIRYIGVAPELERLIGHAPKTVAEVRAVTRNVPGSALLEANVPKHDYDLYYELYSEIPSLPPKIIKPVVLATLESRESPAAKLRKYTMTVQPVESPIAPALGCLLVNCQHLKGAASGAVYQGVREPWSGFVIIEEDGEIVGASWFWLSDNNKQFVFDSVEGNYQLSHNKHGTHVVLSTLYLEASQFLAKKYGFTTVAIGSGQYAGVKFSSFSPVGDFSPRILPIEKQVKWRSDAPLEYSDALDRHDTPYPHNVSGYQFTFLPEGYVAPRSNSSRKPRSSRSRRSLR